MNFLARNYSFICVLLWLAGIAVFFTLNMPIIMAAWVLIIAFFNCHGIILTKAADGLVNALLAKFPDGRLGAPPRHAHRSYQRSFLRNVEGGLEIAYVVECTKHTHTTYRDGNRSTSSHWKCSSSLMAMDSDQGKSFDAMQEGPSFWDDPFLFLSKSIEAAQTQEEPIVLKRPFFSVAPKKWMGFLEKVPGLYEEGYQVLGGDDVRDAVLGLFKMDFWSVTFGAGEIFVECSSSFSSVEDVTRAMGFLHTIAKARKDYATRMGFDPLAPQVQSRDFRRDAPRRRSSSVPDRFAPANASDEQVYDGLGEEGIAHGRSGIPSRRDIACEGLSYGAGKDGASLSGLDDGSAKRRVPPSPPLSRRRELGQRPPPQ